MALLQEGSKAVRLALLRDKLAQGEAVRRRAARSRLSLDDVPEIERSVPGLAGSALHEVTAATAWDLAAAFGFLLILAGRASGAGSVLFIAGRRAFAGFGSPYGHGIAQLGLDLDRLLLVETRTDRDALWAMEESLRSQAAPAIVAGVVAGDLDLTASRRLSLAAGNAGVPLLLLRPACAHGTSAATTRWRIASAPGLQGEAGFDRFGALAGWRWNVTLERCRNGRIGQWLLEWDHAAHRLRMASILADRALPQSADGLNRAV